jgi:hypothetical protein
MKKTSKIGFIALINITLIGILGAIGVFTFNAAKENGSFTENHIFISVIVGIAVFIAGIATNLTAFFITYFCNQKHTNEKQDEAFERMNKKQDEAFERIKEIKRRTKKESIVLKSKDRNSLYQKGFFDELYNGASDIRISGIKLTSLINYICEEKKSNDNWVKKLEERTNVHVRILMSSPKSEIISTLEKQEGLPAGAIVNNIDHSLLQLSNFSKSNKSYLAQDSFISIRITDVIQHFNITYAGHREPTDKLFLGFLFNKDNGPVYEILPIGDVNTYSECLTLFDNLYKDEKIVFHWDASGIKYDESGIKYTEPKD